MRLDKYLADMGIGTRSQVKKMIRANRVEVSGQVITDPGYILESEESVQVDKETIRYESYVYYMLNKPAGVVSATEDTFQKTVLDLITEQKRSDLFPVGRLDKDTEGLLLITNDGDLAHRLLSPKKHVDKKYFARIDGVITEKEVRAFAKGLQINETFCALPAKLECLTSDTISEVYVTIREGKFHQIKRMFHVLGKEVLYLKRLEMGTLKLDETLPIGSYRRLTEIEVEHLKHDK